MLFWSQPHSMSRCGTCHVPYTKRDIYTLRILPTTDLPPTLSPTMPNTAFIDPKRRQSGLNRRASQSLLDLGSASHVATHNTNRSDARERALLDRIQHLESLVTLRECQVKQWKSQVDKNARTLLGYLREIKELKNEVLSWWRKYQTKDVEYQALRETIARQPLPNGPSRRSPHVPLETTTNEELPLHRKGRHAKPPDGIRIVSYHEYPKKSLSPLFRQQEPPVTPVAVPPPYGA